MFKSKSNILRYCLSPFTDVNLKCSTSGNSLSPLDGIRGLAVLIVISCHTSAFGMDGQGSLGVYLFFVLSGFVLTLPFANNPSRLINFSQLWRFIVNRMLRIMPLFIVVVILVSRQISADLGWIFANLSFVKTWSYFWSVTEEVQFYVLFPIIIGLLALLPNRGMRFLALGLITYFAWKYRSLHLIEMMSGSYIDFYFWFFLGGIMTCLCYTAQLTKKLVANQFVKIIFSNFPNLVLVLLFMSSDQMINQFWRPLFPNLPENLSLNGHHMPELWFFLFILFLLSVLFFRDSFASRFVQSWPLRHLGLLSYSLYLFHTLVQCKLAYYGFTHEACFITVLISTYVIALFLYTFIEKPFLILKPAPSRRVLYGEKHEGDFFRKPKVETVGQ